MKGAQHLLSGFGDVPNAVSTAVDTRPLWTVEDVAMYLRIKPSTVRAMCRRGELPAVKVGRIWRFEKTLLDKKILNDKAGENNAKNVEDI